MIIKSDRRYGEIMSRIFKQTKNQSHAIYKAIHVDEKSPMVFEKITATIIQPSVIAISCGKRENRSVNVLGTAFGVKMNNDEQTNYYATCAHVIDELHYYKQLDAYGIKGEGLIDNKTRIAISKYAKGGINYLSWYELEDKSIKSLSIINEDSCVFQIPPKFSVPPLSLSLEGPYLGGEVGIMGFPTSGNLQETKPQPFVIKTNLCGVVDYKFERIIPDEKGGEHKEIVTCPRFALDHPLAPGFSGSPVFSVMHNGLVVGMVDYTPFERSIWGTKFKFEDKMADGISVIEGDIDGQYPAFASLSIPSQTIQYNLEQYPHYKEEIENAKRRGELT